MKLLVRNLSRTTTEAQLRAAFEPFGDIQSADLVMDKKSGGSKGFGFVEMPNVGEAKAAIHNLNNRELDGSRLRVKKTE